MSIRQTIRVIYGYKEIIIAFIVALALTGAFIQIFLRQNRNQNQISNNAISVNASVTPASNQQIAQKNETLNWQKSVDTQAESNLDGIIYEEIDPNQNFAGNLELPKGWSVAYTCDVRTIPAAERTYTANPSCDLEDVTALRINTGTAQTFKPFSQAPLVQPLEEQALSNGSYKTLLPILYNNKVFQIMQAVNVQDAGSANDFTLNCFDLTSYSQCNGFPTYMSTAIGPLGTGAKNINTPLNMQSYLDANGVYGPKGRLYLPGQTFNSYGVVCIDLEQLSNCGFTSLGTSGPSNTTPGNANPVLLSGFVESGGRLYGHANDADRANQTVVCFNLNTDGNGSDGLCSGYSATTSASTPTYLIGEHNNAYLTTGNHVIDGNRLFWVVNYSLQNTNAGNFFPPLGSQRSWGSVITCFDISTRTHCSGWPNTLGGVNILNNGGGLYVGLERPTTLFAWRNTNGTIRATCLIVGLAQGVDPFMYCYDVTNGAFLNDINNIPGHPARMFPAQWYFLFWTGSPYVTNLTDSEGSKTYFAFYNTENNAVTANPRKGATFCWNWSTASRCANFAAPKYWFEINNSNSGDTGYFYDGSCMWGVGFGDRIWSFNARTGETPCRVARTSYTATVNPTEFYCDGSTPAFSWGKVRLKKSSMYDFQSFNVIVRNAVGNTILEQGNLKSDTELDLSSIPYVGNEQLNIEVVADVYSTSPWANGNLPFVSVVADTNTSSAQYCYQTTSKDYCDVSSISTATGVSVLTELDTLTGTNTTSIPLDQPSNEQCFEDVSLEIIPNKSQISGGDEITYNLRVSSKANTNLFNRGNVIGARIEATLPQGFSFIGASDGGMQQGNKIVWENQTILAAQFIERTVTIKAPTVLARLQKPIKSGTVYAATTQTPVAIEAVVIYNGDVFQADNSAENSDVILTTQAQGNSGGGTGTGNGGTPGDGNSGGGTGTGNGGTGGNDTTGGADPNQGQAPLPDPTDTTVILPPIERTQPGRSNSDSRPEQLTPLAIRNIVPPALERPVENLFQAVYSIVDPVSPTVARTIPYGAIAFLVMFALVYMYQAIRETALRHQINDITKRFRRTEELRSGYIDLTSHYLNTPIATMQSTVDLLNSTQELPQSIIDTAKTRLQRIVQHAQMLLGRSQVVSQDASTAIQSISASSRKSIWLSPGLIVPIMGVLIITILINIVFIWADKYDVNTVTLLIQSSSFVLCVIAIGAAYNNFRHQKFATAIAGQELGLEKELAKSQSEFIMNSSMILQNDINQLEQISPSITKQPRGKTFMPGLEALKQAVAKLTYLNQLTTHSKVPVIPNNTIKEIAEEVVRYHTVRAQEKNVSISSYIEPGLTMIVDVDGFKQLLNSTIDNAIKFNRQGGRIDVNIGRKDDKMIQMIIKDTGRGIAKDKLEKLFVPFSRATDTKTYNFEGFGLDLYMNKLIAEQCGGSISIDSIEGQGTTVTVLLPS